MPSFSNTLEQAIHAALALANARRSIDKALTDFRLQNDDMKVDATMTGLRLVRSVVLPDQKSTVRPYLQASDNAVKREAINVMRVLHGEQPAENLPVFQVIEQANAWLKKV